MRIHCFGLLMLKSKQNVYPSFVNPRYNIMSNNTHWWYLIHHLHINSTWINKSHNSTQCLPETNKFVIQYRYNHNMCVCVCDDRQEKRASVIINILLYSLCFVDSFSIIVFSSNYLPINFSEDSFIVSRWHSSFFFVSRGISWN